jgi:ribosomal protein S4
MSPEVPSPESRRRVATTTYDSGSTEVADRTNGDSYEMLPTYEPPPPMAPALTVDGNRPSSARVVGANSKSISTGLRMRSRREMRGRDPVPQDPDPLAGPAPTVTSVVPNSGSAKGGTTVTITGTNFVPGATVSFGGVPAATTVLVASSTLIVATTPSHTGGAVEEVKGRGVPEWLSFDVEKMSGRIVSLPTREQINLPVQEQLIVELYSK